MHQGKNQLQFFLGVNTPQGYVSRFDHLADVEDGWRVFVIKGAPGSGKSSLLKKVAQVFEDRCPDIQYILCSSDLDSLDGVVLPSLKIALADGTAPHAIEPKYPGVYETVINMSECWDERILAQRREEIIGLYRQGERLQELCSRYLGAAAALLYDTYRIALELTDTAKISRFADRLCAKELRPRDDIRGRETVRFLSGVTNRGSHLFTQTAKELAERIILVEDDYGASSRLLLAAIRAHALEKGYDLISCYCPLAPFDKLEHLFIPELSLGFVTCNRFHTFEMEPYKVINARRFTDLERIKLRKRRISFNRKAAAQMLTQAEILTAESKENHDQLEACYRQAMDFDHTTVIAAKLIDRLESLATQREREEPRP